MLVSIANFVSQSLPSQVTIAGIVVEAILRMVKTDKPMSIAHGVSGALAQIAIISKGIADFLDKIFPQSLK